MRLGDAADVLARTINMFYVPFIQVVKAIAWMFMSVNKKVWAAERKARRIVGREYALKVLELAVKFKPPPPFEINPFVVSFAVDQTRIRESGSRRVGTGISRYRAIATVDEHGESTKAKDLTYMNGQHYPVPASFPVLSPAAQNLIRSWGPYTQDFGNVIAFLDPSKSEAFLGELLLRACTMLEPVSDQRGDTKACILALLRRGLDLAALPALIDPRQHLVCVRRVVPPFPYARHYAHRQIFEGFRHT